MATVIENLTGEIIASCALNEVSINTDLDSISLALSVGGSVVFSQNYTPLDNKLTVRNLDKLMLSWFKANNACFVNCKISVFAEGYTAAVASKSFVCLCSYAPVSDFSSTTRFLSTATHKRISPDGTDKLHFIEDPEERGFEYSVNAVYIDASGERNVIKFWVPEQHSINSLGVEQIDIDVPTVLAGIAQWGGVSGAKQLLAFTVSYGFRSMFYTVEEMNLLCIEFRNIFNCTETLYLRAKATKKTDTTKSIAIVAGKRKHYDVSQQLSFEVETAILSADESTMLQQVAHSDELVINGFEAVITDADIAFCTEPENLNTSKFTWRPAAELSLYDVQLITGIDLRIHTQPFDIQFT